MRMGRVANESWYINESWFIEWEAPKPFLGNEVCRVS